jgi:hypothetical protein
VRRALLAVIRLYQAHVSAHTPASCRFEPTCSAYAHEAITRHGAAVGTWLAVKRVARCGPWTPPGHDPVPLVAAFRRCSLSCELARYGRAAWCAHRHNLRSPEQGAETT